MNKQKWVVTGVAVPAILTLVVLGFTSMSVNPPFTVPTWLPTLFFISAGITTVALVSYLMWESLGRLRFQSPIILYQPGKTDAASLNKAQKGSPPTLLEHDGVLWEDGGWDVWGNVNVIGPLCPKDYTPLSIIYKDNIEAKISYDTYISGSADNYQLICLECHTRYNLGKNLKKIRDSHDEVAVRILGIRKREQENQAT